MNSHMPGDVILPSLLSIQQKRLTLDPVVLDGRKSVTLECLERMALNLDDLAYFVVSQHSKK